MAGYTYKPNPAGRVEMQREIERAPSGDLVLLEAANRLLEIAKLLAPKGPTGDYEKSLEIVFINGRIFVATTDPAGHLVEWGNYHHPPYAVLRRAARMAGLTLRERPK